MSDVPKLILHIGHAKTASSMLQSTMARSVDALEAQGVIYPRHAGFHEAAQGRISGGNLDSANPDLEKRFLSESNEHRSARAILFSNESIFQDLQKVRAALQGNLAKGVEVEVVFFIRDPLEHAVSGFSQVVKRHGYSGDLAQWLKNYKTPLNLMDNLTEFAAMGVKVQFANYSRHPEEITKVFCAMIGVDPLLMNPAPVTRVNRSLSAAELVIMQALNCRYDLNVTSKIADALCNELPGVESGVPQISGEDFDAFVSLVTPMIESANRVIPEDQHYRVPSYEEYVAKGMIEMGSEYCFSREQLELIVCHLPSPRMKPERVTKRNFLAHLNAKMRGRNNS